MEKANGECGGELNRVVVAETFVNNDGDVEVRFTAARPIDETPPWFEVQLQELADLPPNWNSYRARPIDARAIAAVRALLETKPFIVPTSMGGVQLEWHTPHGDYELEIGPNGLERINGIDEVPL